MNESDPDWLSAGQGIRPQRSWSLTTDAPLVSMQLTRETGELLAADSSGGLYLLDRRGQVTSLTRGFQRLHALAWSDTGNCGAAVIGGTKLCRLNRDFKVQWSVEFPETVLAIAIHPFGNYLAVALANGSNRVYDAHKRPVGRFDTIRPLSFLQFLATEPTILGAAEYGLLCCHELDGVEIWSEKLWSSVGDVSVSGDGQTIYLASFTHGIKIFDGDGNHRGSYVVEGTPNRIAASFAPKRLVVTTLERQLYWLDSDGELLWAAHPPDDICCLGCDPLGNGIICGFNSGRLIRLDWEPSE